jgi:hypothetical protein
MKCNYRGCEEEATHFKLSFNGKDLVGVFQPQLQNHYYIEFRDSRFSVAEHQDDTLVVWGEMPTDTVGPYYLVGEDPGHKEFYRKQIEVSFDEKANTE